MIKYLSLAFFFFTSITFAQPYSLEARGAPVADLVRLLTFMKHQNVIIPGDIIGHVTASFPSIELEDALGSILNSNQLAAELNNEILEISSQKTREALGKDLITQNFNLNYANAAKVASQSQAFMSSGKGSIVSDEQSNSLTIRGTTEQLKSIESLINNIDRPDKQVLIEVKIVDASRSFTQSIGVQWGVSASPGSSTIGGINGAGTSQAGRPLMVGTPSNTPITGIASTIGIGSTLLDAQLSMGEENGDLAILSRPSIVTLNNQPATIKSGLKFYVKTAGSVTIASGGGNNPAGAAGVGTPASGASTANATLSEINAGITLVVTPHITPDNKISLQIHVTSAQPDYSKLVDGVPSIADNTATTSVLLKNGTTTVIGGLSRNEQSNKKQGVPGLSRIPFLGALFGRTSKEKSNRELIIFITPTVLDEEAMAK